MPAPSATVASIVVVGLTGAATLMIVYGTGVRLPRFTPTRLAIVLAGVSILTVPLPLLTYYAKVADRSFALLIAALYVIAVVVIGLATPDDEVTS